MKKRLVIVGLGLIGGSLAKALRGFEDYEIIGVDVSQPTLRYAMEQELRTIWEKEKRTVCFVTNNIEEAIYLGDRVVVMSALPGRVKTEYSIDIPSPRAYTHPDFLTLRKQISEDTDLVL